MWDFYFEKFYFRKVIRNIYKEYGIGQLIEYYLVKFFNISEKLDNIWYKFNLVFYNY